jgi:hypothetical protein
VLLPPPVWRSFAPEGIGVVRARRRDGNLSDVQGVPAARWTDARRADGRQSSRRCSSCGSRRSPPARSLESATCPTIILDRSVIVAMKRRAPHEHIEAFHDRHARPEGEMQRRVAWGFGARRLG